MSSDVGGSPFCACDRYKVEGVVDADPETVFSYIDPSPASPRAQWDKAIKELHVVEQLDKVTPCSIQCPSLFISLITLRFLPPQNLVTFFTRQSLRGVRFLPKRPKTHQSQPPPYNNCFKKILCL